MVWRKTSIILLISVFPVLLGDSLNVYADDNTEKTIESLNNEIDSLNNEIDTLHDQLEDLDAQALSQMQDLVTNCTPLVTLIALGRSQYLLTDGPYLDSSRLEKYKEIETSSLKYLLSYAERYFGRGHEAIAKLEALWDQHKQKTERVYTNTILYTARELHIGRDKARELSRTAERVGQKCLAPSLRK